MFIYGDSADLGKPITYQLYRISRDQFFDIHVPKDDSFAFTADLHKGTPNKPFWFSDNEQFVGIDFVEHKSTVAFEAYPNLFNSNLNMDVKAENAGIAAIVMYDVMGKQVYNTTHNCEVGNNKFSVNPQNLPAGVYIVKLELNSIIKTVKLVKQ
jgi:hypothetical protein